MRKIGFLSVILLVLIGCATASGPGRIGSSDIRRLVILGEHVDQGIAQKYANEFNARVFYSRNSGAIAGAVSNALSSTLGPSRFMRDLINEFISMSNTTGDWEIIIPKQAEHYIAVTLRNMRDNTVTNCAGSFILPDSSVNAEVEKEVRRVFGEKWNVKY